MDLIMENITKKFANGVVALDSVSMKLSSGMHGLLGPNGAGKSTLMRILATLVRPDSGTVRFNGIDLVNEPEPVRSMLGYLPQEFGLYDDLSAEKMLSHLAVLKGVTHGRTRRAMVRELLDQTNLLTVRKQKLGTFSGGMRRRFGIAQALINEPALLIVDEPTAGLDPEERCRFYNILSEVARERIVLLSTHIVEDISVLCPGLTILNRGQIQFSGSVDDALALPDKPLWEGECHNDEWQQRPEQEQRVLQQYYRSGRKMVRILSNTHPGPGFTKINPTLEDAYFEVIHAR